jgi:hypothetical protein
MQAIKVRNTVSTFALVGALPALAYSAQPETSDAVGSHTPRERVELSMLPSVGFSERRHILEIEFINGAIYGISMFRPQSTTI